MFNTVEIVWMGYASVLMMNILITFEVSHREAFHSLIFFWENIDNLHFEEI